MRQSDSEDLEAARIKYAALRSITQTLVEEDWFSEERERIVVTSLEESSKAYFETHWQGHPSRKVSFDWFGGIWRTLRKSHPRRMEFGFWKNKVLCGLAVGRISKGGTWLSITHIEGNPDLNHPLKGKIIALAIFSAQVYAVGAASEERKIRPRVRILNPLSPVVAHYKKLGYDKHVTSKRFSYLAGEYLVGEHHENTEHKS